MAHDVTLPPLGESVTEGTVTRWLKKVGDTVSRDEPLLEISTDKVDTEIPSPIAGTVVEILVPVDDVVSVGAVLARIGEPDETVAAPTPEANASDEPPYQPKVMPSPSSTATPPLSPPSAPPPSPEPQPAPALPPSPGLSDVVLPPLGESVTEGTVTRWLKKVGDPVARNEPLLEISTDKVDTEIPSPVAGTLTDILVDADQVASVGAVLARVASGDSTQTAAPATEASKTPVSPPSTPEPSESPAPSPSTPEPSESPIPSPAPSPEPRPPASTDVLGGTYLTPLVRKLATERGIDLTSVVGTGSGGRITRDDILKAAPIAPPSPTPAPEPEPAATTSPLQGKTEKMSRLRTIISERMMESLHGTAQLTTVVEVDMSRVWTLRAKAKDTFQSREGAKLTYLPFFTKATTEALTVHPVLNASIDGDSVVYHDAVHLGIAVDTDKGLIVPTIKDADSSSLADHARAIADLGERARTNSLTPDDLTGATFTVTNTGSVGALFDTPIIPSPQVGILGTGIIAKRPVVIAGPDEGEVIAIRPMCYLSLTYDHRLVDGADAARFLATVKERIEAGAFEAEVGP